MLSYPYRDVYCLFGLPVDVVSMEQTVQCVRSAITERHRLFLSTPNLNFLIGSRTNAVLRTSVIDSNLSVADGMPLVWMARLLGLPISERVTGSGLFERLLQSPRPAGARRVSLLGRLMGFSAKEQSVNADLFQQLLRSGPRSGTTPLRVYFFGGPPGVAAQAHGRINAVGATGLRSVGYACPGFGSVEEMSTDAIIDTINATQADILIVALGAAKGQAWIEHNLKRLTVPVVSHLGAVVNFAAGTVNRAPLWMQRSGLEWLWRIKEEPGLWRRYWHDGRVLLVLLLTQLLPYALWLRWGGGRHADRQSGRISLSNPEAQDPTHEARLTLSGDMVGPLDVDTHRVLSQAACGGVPLRVDVSAARVIGSGFWAQLLLLRQHLRMVGLPFRLEGASESLRRQMRWNGVEDLLDVPPPASPTPVLTPTLPPEKP